MSGIKIDGQTFSVRLTTEPIGGDDGERSFLGQSDEGNNTIVIDGTMPQERQEEVLLHEIIHMSVAGLPESLVRDLGVRLHGVLRENGMLVEDVVGLVSDGDVTPEDMSRLNKESNKAAQQPMMMGMFRVSEKLWSGPVFGDTGDLRIHDTTGAVSRSAVHMATSQLLGAQGGVKLSAGKKRLIACNLLDLYRDVLKEPLPKSLVEMSR